MSMSVSIGKSIYIKGEIVAREPFLISGHVDGTIDIDGHTLTISEGQPSPQLSPPTPS